MPYPVAHGIIGATVVAALRRRLSLSYDWKWLAVGFCLAICPDFDYFFPWFLGLDWHRGFTHSLVFAIFSGVVAAFAICGAFGFKEAIVCATAILSHTLFDFLTARAAVGVELFWPLTRRKYGSDTFDYPDIHFNPLGHHILVSLLNLLEISLIELILFTPILITVVYYVRRRTSASD